MLVAGTHNVNVSLYLGAQLLFFDLVAYFLFLSLRWGPMMNTSTKGRNIPDVCHRRSFAATTTKKCIAGLIRLVINTQKRSAEDARPDLSQWPCVLLCLDEWRSRHGSTPHPRHHPLQILRGISRGENDRTAFVSRALQRARATSFGWFCDVK